MAGAGYSSIADEENPLVKTGENGAKSGSKNGGLLLLLGLLGGAAAIYFLDRSGALVGTPSSSDNSSTPSGEKIIPDGFPEEGKLFDTMNRYILEDFDNKKNFGNFLPGVAGLFGKPTWSFYVNRGQAVTSFGLESKDYPFLEFDPANKAYQKTPFVGFRTFLQGTKDGKDFLVEPFSPSTSRRGDDQDESKPKRFMYVGRNDVEIRDYDFDTKVETVAQYFTLPEENFASFVRRSTITNFDETSPVTLSVLDGLAKMEPKGGALNGMLHDMGRTLEGWFEVLLVDGNVSLPIYKMSSEPSDTASVKIVEGGNYCISFLENDPDKLLPIVYDTGKVFGEGTSLESPRALNNVAISDIVADQQYGYATTSSAFAAVESITLQPGESITIASFYGQVDSTDKISAIVDTITKPGYVDTKFKRGRQIIKELTSSVETHTGDHLFDGLVQQFFLDNALRGGMPLMLGDVDDAAKQSNMDEDERVKVFHTFSRIHGDLERDYNFFKISPEYFSQGPGNYRDVAQNRRNDVVFQPRMGSFDVKMFLSFIQADGYEPLTVEAIAFQIFDKEKAKAIAAEAVGTEPEVLGSYNQLVDVLTGGYVRPGQLFGLIDQLDIPLKLDNWTFINMVLAASEYTPIAQYGDGYWSDHWDYYLDLINAYLMIYPDKEEELMYNNQLRYFFSPATVNPRSKKYVLDYTFDYASQHVQQLGSTYWDTSKEDQQKKYWDSSTGLVSNDASWQSDENFEVFTSTPIAKLFLLGTQKFAMRDAYGMGVEYEGGKPGWNDAMNGLVGMVGSGMPEAYEMKLLLEYVQSVVSKFDREIVIPEELNTLVTAINNAMDTLESSGYVDADELSKDVPGELFTYWDTVATARETYREEVKYHFSGSTVSLSGESVDTMISRWLKHVDLGLARAVKIGTQGDGDDGKSGISPTYFSYDITSWEETGNYNNEGHSLVNATSMAVGSFPLFLEGPVRYLKTIENDKVASREVYDKVLNSGLRDTELGMYFISASLKGQDPSMGRMMAFTPGWLENQSIWIHMSYKYYLQLIRAGLFKEFFGEMKGGGMLPYMDPDVYGRSLMECSSFIASSAFPDPKRHGQGFLARLSGSTAEFLSIYVLMMVGPKPYYVDENGDLNLQLIPALPKWIFKDPKTDNEVNDLQVTFNLFSAIPTTYHNTLGVDLYDVKPTSYVIRYKSGQVKRVNGSSVPSDIAVEIRRIVNISSINVYF